VYVYSLFIYSSVSCAAGNSYVKPKHKETITRRVALNPHAINSISAFFSHYICRGEFNEYDLYGSGGSGFVIFGCIRVHFVTGVCFIISALLCMYVCLHTHYPLARLTESSQKWNYYLCVAAGNSLGVGIVRRWRHSHISIRSEPTRRVGFSLAPNRCN